MSQAKNYKYDGKSRPSNVIYEKRWNSVKVKDLKKLLKETNGATKKTNRTTD